MLFRKQAIKKTNKYVISAVLYFAFGSSLLLLQTDIINVLLPNFNPSSALPSLSRIAISTTGIIFTLFGTFLFFRFSIERGTFSPLIKSDDRNENLILNQLRMIETKLEQKTSESNILSDEDKKDISQKIRNQISQELNTDFMKEVEKKYGSQLEKQAVLKDLNEQCLMSQERLRSAIIRVDRRNTTSLFIAIITTGFAVFVLLSTFVDLGFGTSPIKYKLENASYLEFFYVFAPRLSFSIFIELFPFFFLRQYGAGLDEVKYFQNELTNMEAKFIALRHAFIIKDDSAQLEIIKTLSNTERNFVLKKGETTVNVEKSKLLQEEVNVMRNGLFEMLNFNKNSNK